MLRKAVFLNQIGVFVENPTNNGNSKNLKLVENGVQGLKKLHADGYELILLANHPGVALGHYSEQKVIESGEQIQRLFEKNGIPITAIYFCPHLLDGKVPQYSVNCFCKLPRPGMVFQAAREHDLSLVDSWMIGVSLDDIEAGRKAECNTILINSNGGLDEWNSSPFRRSQFTVPSFSEAVNIVCDAKEETKDEEEQTKESA
jgi:D-glycero-D-manno-heptose 1,7-bisphosphate phosphatase